MLRGINLFQNDSWQYTAVESECTEPRSIKIPKRFNHIIVTSSYSLGQHFKTVNNHTLCKDFDINTISFAGYIEQIEIGAYIGLFSFRIEFVENRPDIVNNKKFDVIYGASLFPVVRIESYLYCDDIDNDFRYFHIEKSADGTTGISLLDNYITISGVTVKKTLNQINIIYSPLIYIKIILKEDIFMLRTVRELQDKMKFTLSSNILGNKWKRIIRMMNETAVHWKPFGNVVILNITSHTGNTVMNDTVVCTNGHSSVGVIKQISAGGYTNFRYRLVGDNYNECYIEIMDTKTMHALEKPNEPMDINITVTTIGQTVVSFVNQYVEDHDIPTDMSVLCDTYTYQEKPRNIIYNDGAIKIEQISEDLGILHIDALINFINGELVGNTWKYYWSGVQFDKPVNYDLLSKTYDMNTSLLFHATNRSHHVTVEMSVNGFTQTFGNGQWYVHGYALVRLIHNLQKKKQQLAKIINITSFIRKYNKNIINNKEVYLYA